MKINNYFACLFAAFFFSGCGTAPEGKKDIPNTEPPKEENSAAVKPDSALLLTTSENLIDLLKKEDFNGFASFIDPEKGLLISPKCFLDSSSFNTFKGNEFVKAIGNDSPISWGLIGESEDTLRLSLRKFLNKFMQKKRNFTKVSGKRSEIAAMSNAVDNTSEFFKDPILVEYIYPGTKSNNNMDWVTLEFIFSARKDKYTIIGLIFNQWSP